MDHMLNVVTLAGGKEYMVDVGFGRHSPSTPLPLLADGTIMATKHGEYRLFFFKTE
jgi:arylamine N-acetyltransferase